MKPVTLRIIKAFGNRSVKQCNPSIADSGSSSLESFHWSRHIGYSDFDTLTLCYGQRTFSYVFATCNIDSMLYARKIGRDWPNPPDAIISSVETVY